MGNIWFKNGFPYWGNYGGPGNSGQGWEQDPKTGKWEWKEFVLEPADPILDPIFRKHDEAYREAEKEAKATGDMSKYRDADRQLRRDLQNIDPLSLDEEGQGYRSSAIDAFKMKMHFDYLGDNFMPFIDDGHSIILIPRDFNPWQFLFPLMPGDLNQIINPFDDAAGLGNSFMGSPIILDLDGDGVETVGVKDGAYFDHDGNGFAEQTGWASSHDGLLVMDRNGDGIINGGKELFGNETLLANGAKAANGFQALAELDSNHDGHSMAFNGVGPR